MIIFVACRADDSVLLAWDPSLDEAVAGYRLHYGFVSGSYDAVLDAGNVTSSTLSGLTAGQTYFVVVTAYSTDGIESLPSNEVSFVPALSSDAGEPETGEQLAFSNTSYHALISSDDPDVSFRGFLTMRTTSQGMATGQITIDGVRYSWVSAFDDTGRLTVTIERHPSLAPLTATITITEDGDRLSGTISDGMSNTTVELASVAPPEPGTGSSLPGRYTLTFPPIFAAPSEPQGYGFGSLNISWGGTVRASGVLPDGTRFSVGGPLNQSGTGSTVSLYASLYQRTGFLAGELIFRDLPEESDADGSLLWVKPARARDAQFQQAFTIPLAVRAARYQPNPIGPILAGLGSSGHATLSFSGDEPAGSNIATYPVIIYKRNRSPALWAFGEPLSATFDVDTGLFRGDFTLPDGRTRQFQGALFQKGCGYGCGTFLDSRQSGRLDLVPTP